MHLWLLSTSCGCIEHPSVHDSRYVSNILSSTYNNMGTAGESPGEPPVQKMPCDEQALPSNLEEDSEANELFSKLWRNTTDDNTLSLYGFRRYRTTHLLNLRLLEHEIDKLDHQIFQAGLRLGPLPATGQRLGLEYGKQDPTLGTEVAVSQKMMLQLRELVKQYGKSPYCPSPA